MASLLGKPLILFHMYLATNNSIPLLTGGCLSLLSLPPLPSPSLSRIAYQVVIIFSLSSSSLLVRLPEPQILSAVSIVCLKEVHCSVTSLGIQQEILEVSGHAIWHVW